MNEQTAQTILSVARQYCEHGRELPPHVIAELEAISTSQLLHWSLRCEAESLLEVERLG